MTSTGRKTAFSLLAAGALVLVAGGGFAVAADNEDRVVLTNGAFSNIEGLTITEQEWEVTNCVDVREDQHVIPTYAFLMASKNSTKGTVGLYSAHPDITGCLVVSKALGSTSEEALDRIRSEEFGYPAPQSGHEYVASWNRYLSFDLDEVVKTKRGVFLSNQWDQWVEIEPDLVREVQ